MFITMDFDLHAYSYESFLYSNATFLVRCIWTFDLAFCQLSQCNSGLGVGGDIGGCQEGDFTHATAMLSFERKNSDAETVVNELATLLTSGRLCEENRQIIKDAYTKKLPDRAAALRMAQQLIVTSPEFHATNSIRKSNDKRVLATKPQPKGTPYKAVIFLMLDGGADSFNMLIPTCTRLYNEYVEVRKQVAIQPKHVLLQIDAKSSQENCESFGLHPKLAAAHTLYNENGEYYKYYVL